MVLPASCWNLERLEPGRAPIQKDEGPKSINRGSKIPHPIGGGKRMSSFGGYKEIKLRRCAEAEGKERRGNPKNTALYHSNVNT
ncbi:unnamed protein product, partial [Vitis vinifera]|uniref:Uncharacterized protein n=1 Tax=Vitis vinifera TaxID=29760 RepID=E0CUQ8_VITVI